LVRTDISHRAIPWSKLFLESREIVNDLNLQNSKKLCTGLLGAVILMLPLSLFIPRLLYLAVFFLVAIIVINRKLINFFLERRGIQFTVLASAMYLLYYLYSGASHASC